jgi:hypothetical protein
VYWFSVGAFEVCFLGSTSWCFQGTYSGLLNREVFSMCSNLERVKAVCTGSMVRADVCWGLL